MWKNSSTSTTHHWAEKIDKEYDMKYICKILNEQTIFNHITILKLLYSELSYYIYCKNYINKKRKYVSICLRIIPIYFENEEVEKIILKIDYDGIQTHM